MSSSQSDNYPATCLKFLREQRELALKQGLKEQQFMEEHSDDYLPYGVLYEGMMGVGHHLAYNIYLCIFHTYKGAEDEEYRCVGNDGCAQCLYQFLSQTSTEATPSWIVLVAHRMEQIRLMMETKFTVYCGSYTSVNSKHGLRCRYHADNADSSSDSESSDSESDEEDPYSCNSVRAGCDCEIGSCTWEYTLERSRCGCENMKFGTVPDIPDDDELIQAFDLSYEIEDWRRYNGREDRLVEVTIVRL